MENFIVSARKYRPATFDMVVGQSSITNTLINAIKNRHLAQSYLFCGPRGVGKTTCARIFAKTINCSNLNDEGEACDKCESCISFNTLRSFNIHELDAASNNKVDDIRMLTDQVRIPPQVGKYSIYIIDEVHMLSSSAFNAFLKTLEEPPSHAIFILATTEKHKIIPTILSRCQIFDFNRIRVEDIVSRLTYVAEKESVTAEEEALHIIAQKADGALRDALSIFDQIVSFSGKEITYKNVIENLNVLDYEYYFRSVDAAIEGNVSKILMIFNEVLEKGFDGHNFVAGLNSHLRNLLVSRDQATIRLLEATQSARQRYIQQAGNCSELFLFSALDAGSACDLSYKNSKNQRLHVELALVKMCRINADLSSDLQKKKSDSLINAENGPPVKIKQETSVSMESTEKITQVNPQRKSYAAYDNSKEAQLRSLSIKDLMTEEPGNPVKDPGPSPMKHDHAIPGQAAEGFSPDKFMDLWNKFSEDVKRDGPRIASMFKSIKPEVHPDNTITIHLSNVDQCDLFSRNYKQRLVALLASRFSSDKLSVEAKVDMAETNGIIYSDEQKYNFLVNKYPSLKEIRKTFNLDFE